MKRPHSRHDDVNSDGYGQSGLSVQLDGFLWEETGVPEEPEQLDSGL